MFACVKNILKASLWASLGDSLRQGPSPPLLAKMVAGCNPLRKRTTSIVTSESNPMPMAANDMGMLLSSVATIFCTAFSSSKSLQGSGTARHWHRGQSILKLMMSCYHINTVDEQNPAPPLVLVFWKYLVGGFLARGFAFFDKFRTFQV